MPLLTRLLYGGITEELLTQMGITDTLGMDCMEDISKRPWYTASNLLCKRNRDFVSCVRNWPFANRIGTRS